MAYDHQRRPVYTGGISFIVLAHAPTMGIVNLAGYSAFGAFYYLLAALRVSKTINF